MAKIFTKTAAVVIAGLAIALPVQAERKVEIEPSFGTERTATVGSTITTRYISEVEQAIVATSSGTGKMLWGRVTLPAGERLSPVYSNSKLKACVEVNGTPWGPCGLDDDGDGTFDRVATDQATTAIKLPVPVAYEKRELRVPSSDRYKQNIIYLGATGDTLRLSYREFLNDLARPAFTEDLTLPLGKAFPQTVAIKDIKITLIGLDGLGLRYKLER